MRSVADDGEVVDEFAGIVSPLAENVLLDALLKDVTARETAFAAAGRTDGDDVDEHYAAKERLAVQLAHLDHTRVLDRWDWAVSFLSDGRFADLYFWDVDDTLTEFIREDLIELLADPNWWRKAKAEMSRREMENLGKVLSIVEVEGRGRAMLQVQRLLA